MWVWTIMGVASAQPWCVAHRGNADGVDRASENSLGAIRRALEVGADGIEVDLRYTRDGVPIVLHDARLARTASGASCPLHADVGLLTFDEIRSACTLRGGEPIPTLGEVLELAASAGPEVPVVVLEFKSNAAFGSPTPTEATLAELGRWSAEHPGRLYVISFDPAQLERVEGADPSIVTLQLRVAGSDKVAAVDGLDLWHQTAGRRLHDRAPVVGVWWSREGGGLKRWLRRDVAFVTTNEARRCAELASEAAG